jgi:hypothetical protein
MLTETQKNTLFAFLECYDLHGPAWSAIEQGMRDDFGVDDPENDLEDARSALST